ncbi:hypothetical protein Pedsa_2058 [Pseudopedobacter saltans DSM 12145]|uniref:Uncharacterized protein n=1 Tax=Pseudopedobacter saltans (strain ATCC 51119 / DSM 12145 / JCM 21818 / CCUG 39354 / LMG 10337 / NBRC 100064 / NCIMB 13643) TaxID=762903 RepID=F0SAJ0_PSESL|nr:hypothetical protein Pedsa_2058 [Pseudopedobacter saltans DSM 12145]
MNHLKYYLLLILSGLILSCNKAVRVVLEKATRTLNVADFEICLYLSVSNVLRNMANSLKIGLNKL